MEPKAPISRLPVQLLALVLQHVGARERLKCCATVCSTWRAAAVLETHSIVARGASIVALSEWLKAHAAAVPVESISVQGYGSNRSTLKLPVEQLPKLRKLDLHDVLVSVQGVADPAELPAELSSRLTHLTLSNCPLKLTRLGDFQQLQDLALLEGHRDSHAASSSDCEALAAALPRLQHLTQLVLWRSWAADAVLLAAHHLPRLLVLDVSNSRCTAAGFAALPATLTKLVIMHCPELVCGPSTTPGLTQLTALQWLEVGEIAEFDAAALVNSKQLQHLCLRDLKLSNDPEAGQGPQLSVLQHMTRLQHLELPSHRDSPNSFAGATAQDFAVLTASSQLTYLDISIIGELEYKWGYTHMFPGQGRSRHRRSWRVAAVAAATRQLPQLRVLVASMCLLENADGLSGLVACAPHLEEIDLSTECEAEDSDDYTHEEVDEMHNIVYTHKVSTLGALSGLTKLQLHMQDRRPGDETWRGLAYLTTLKSLTMYNLDNDYLGGVLKLTSCRQLTHLDIDNDDSPGLYLVTRRGTPDLWQQLARGGLVVALRHLHDRGDMPVPNRALHSLATAASEHSLQLEVTCKQLRQQVTGLRQEVTGLHATVAAMAAQLHAAAQSLLE